MNPDLSPVKVTRSFSHALRGIIGCFKTEANFKIHLLLSSIAIAAAALLQLSAWKWGVISVCIAMVLAAEMLNTAIEKLCDVISPGYHPQIKLIKDMAAGAVLVTALISFFTGLMIFLPSILFYFKS